MIRNGLFLSRRLTQLHHHQIRFKSSNLHKRAVSALNKNSKSMAFKNKNESPKATSATSATQTATKVKPTQTASLASSNASPKINGAPPPLSQVPPPSFTSPSPLPIHQGHLMEFAPKIVVVGVGGGGGNAVNNMIANELQGKDLRLSIYIYLHFTHES